MEKKRVYTVLAIDGGGIRGIIAARFLQEIEERTGKPLAELFDLIGGTSTGSILAAGANVPDENNPKKPKYSAKQLKEFYYKSGEKIFNPIRFRQIRHLLPGSVNSGLYDPTPLENSLEEEFGDLQLKSSLTSLMIPATDIKNFQPVWMKHIKGTKDPEGWGTMKMRDAVRASTTAPLFFPARYHHTTHTNHAHPESPEVENRHALIDGGFFSGTMTRRLLTQARKVAPPDAEVVVIHVGTGYAKVSLSPEEFNRLGPLGMVRKESGSLLISLATNMTGIDTNNDMQDELGDRFFSFDGVMDPNDPDGPNYTIDDASPENLQKLEDFAEKLIMSMSDDIDRACKFLTDRIYKEHAYHKSEQALEKLANMMETVDTAKSLTKFYGKIVHFGSDLPEPENMTAEDRTLCALSKDLNENHQFQLERIYRSQLDKKLQQSRFINAFKEVSKKMAKPFKQKKAKHMANDNKKTDYKPPAMNFSPNAAKQKASGGGNKPPSITP